jgi:hypothetical protein
VRTRWTGTIYYKALPKLKNLESMQFPSLYSEDTFDEIDGFLTILDEPLVKAPGMSFNRIEIYVECENVKKLIDQFEELSSRFQEYEPLQPFL